MSLAANRPATFGQIDDLTRLGQRLPIFPDGSVPKTILFEDNFDNGACNWTQLIHAPAGGGPIRPIGVLTMDTEISHGGSSSSLMLSTGDQPNTGGNYGSCMAIKRLSRGPDTGRVFYEFFWSWGSLAGQNTPRAIQFGLDEADENGVRRYYKVRWENWRHVSGGSGSGRTMQYQLLLGDNTMLDIPGAVFEHGYNENKRNLNHLEMIVDLNANVYDGLRINGVGFGSLADVPNDSLRAYGTHTSTLVPFSLGMNATFEVLNRTDTVNTAAWANLAYARGLLL